MQHNTQHNVHYERLESGIDVALLKTGVHDVVGCKIALGLGANATYKKKSIAQLASELLPAGTSNTSRSAVREAFGMMGADVSVSLGDEHVFATLTSRRTVFAEALALLLTTLSVPVFSARDFKEAQTHVRSGLAHSAEDTSVQAGTALARTLFAKGHPHWMPTALELSKELDTVTLGDVRLFYKDIFTSLGGLIVVVGDISPRTLATEIRNLCDMVPTHRPERTSDVHAGKTAVVTERDLIHPMKDKMNVDVYLGLPMTLTRDDDDFHPLTLGVSILGGSSNGRLHEELRVKRGLTYGSYATLAGLADGYPGYLQARAIFPNDMFTPGRAALREVVEHFIEKGVTTREVEKKKEEIVGKFKVSLATSSGQLNALFSALLSGRAPSYVAEYPSMMAALPLRVVNKAIHEHLDYGLSVTTAAGGVSKDGAKQ